MNKTAPTVELWRNFHLNTDSIKDEYTKMWFELEIKDVTGNAGDAWMEQQFIQDSNRHVCLLIVD